MGRLISSALGLVALLAASLGFSPAPAFADPDISQICSVNNDFGFSHGACVSLLESDQHSSALFVSVCKILQEQLPDFFDATFKNRGDCVSALNNQFK